MFIFHLAVRLIYRFAEHRSTFLLSCIISSTCLLDACDGSGGSSVGEFNSEPAIAVNSPSSTTITFIHLNDLHAHLTTHTEKLAYNGEISYEQRGGLARIAGAINQIRADNPNSVLMNIGDTYHGGVEALYTQGNAIVDPVNALGIDVGVPGNWDFAYGPGVTRARYTGNASGFNVNTQDIKQPAFPNLAANVTYTSPPGLKGQTFLPATIMLDVAGIKIGFIGITSDIVPLMHQALAVGLDFLQGEAAYVDLISTHSAQLKTAGANAVVVMSELGIHKDFRLANIISPGTVDVFFSAHTHEATFTPVVATSGAWVVEAGNDTYLGRLDMQFDNGAPVTRNWSLLEVDSRFTEDPKVAALVDQARAPFLAADVNMSLSMSNTQMRLTQAIDTVVGQAPLGLDRRQALENRFNDSYTDALRRYSGTQIAITPGFRYDAVIPGTNENYEDPAVVAGQVTVEDAYRFFPVPFTLSTANVSGTRLKQVIEQNLTAVFSTDRFARAGGWFDGYSGVNLQLKLSNPDGRRVTGILMQDSGAILADNDTLSIAGCSRPFDRDGSTTICSYDGFTEVTPLLNPLTQSPWLGVDFLIYALENGLLNTAPPATRITDQSATVFWPESDFYQPL